MRDASRPRSESTRGVLLILVSTAAYGTMPILAKVVMARGVTTGALLAWRFALTTVLFALLTRGPTPALRQRLVLWSIGAVFIGNALLYFTALETVPATTVSLLLYTYPVIVTLLSAVLGPRHHPRHHRPQRAVLVRVDVRPPRIHPARIVRRRVTVEGFPSGGGIVSTAGCARSAREQQLANSPPRRRSGRIILRCSSRPS